MAASAPSYKNLLLPLLALVVLIGLLFARNMTDTQPPESDSPPQQPTP